MSAKVETTVRQWSTPVQKVVEGQPPRPEDNPTTITGEARRSDIRTVTPSYKYGTEKPSYEIKFGSSTNLPEAVGDYKVKETQDHFKLQIIDPKVTSNANMPVSSQTIPAAYRRNVDFPSEHSKRSFLKLEPMEQRKIRSVETRPITTSAYLTESLDRHREMEASRLREYLKAKESDANKPWNKPDWPGPKARQDNEQSIRELEEIKKTIETLQRAANEPKKQPRTNPATVIQEQIREMLESRISNDTSVNSTIPQQDRSGYVTDVSSATWQFSTQSFSPRSVVSINGGAKTDDGLLKVRTDLSPGLSRTISRSNAAVQTANVIEDDKPRGIMKRRELETKDQMMYADQQPRNLVTQNHWEQREVVQTKPKVTETVQKFEEHKRTEEIERRVQRKERREKKHRSAQRSYHHSGGQEMLGYSDGGYRSNSLSRNGYLPAHESYMRTVTTRRERDGRYSDDGRYHTNGSTRYGGSISDSLRRGEMKYNPNGEIREVHHSSSGRNGRVHKSYSTRDVFDSGNYDDRRSSFSYRRGSQQGGGPFIEFPPTLPRVGADREPPMPPPHRGRSASNDFYRPITKSRSYADWDEGRGFTHAIRRRDEDMARLENEFRDSLLMPLPTGGGNMHERDHRHEQIPGGYETYDREVKSSSGRRLNRDGNPTQFSEASQEYSYRREQESDRRR